GYAVVDIMGDKELLFSEHYACPYCGFSVGELEPRMFSFNSPFGACPTCDGLGTKLEVDVDTVIPDRSLSLNEGAIIPWRPISSQYYPQMLASACKEFGIDMDTPLEKLSKEELDIILNGSKDKEFYFEYKNDFGMTRETWIPFEGILPNIERRYRETNSDFTRDQMAQYMTDLPCPSCKGYRLKEETLSVKVNDHHIGQISEFSINEALAFFDGLELSEKETQIAAPIFKEVRARLGFLKNVGLDYLTMSRAAGT
ncbi:TPA: excinuclease ABC subunit UvrA, partial [Listeria monocytogenes]|nr:excinuclease ABC subunit UvrA [Listeria monocytogenes]